MVNGEKNKEKIPELLAPVGGWQQLKAAVQNGADAVYMGGPLFNARMKAENFSMADMKKAIDYAHLRNVKVYITINILIKDDELFKAFSYVNDLYAMGADAVILQDMGLARLVRKYLPGLDMHLSTQGTVYNKWAVETVKELGFSRVVPARELSLAELQTFAAECHRNTPTCEVEVFIHGALCMCYSGQCQMSRALGGASSRSGNRGLCAQPCRLPYTDEAGINSYLLSPKDICVLEDIPALCKAGVDSFKIEGRLKSPHYVAVVTSVYRKYLDQYRDTGDVKVRPADMKKLLQIFNRGGFSKGYLYGNPGSALLSGDSPKNQGVLIGKVSSVKKGSTLVDVELSGKDSFSYRASALTESQSALSMGDGVEIRGAKITGNVLSYLKELSDGRLRIGDIKGDVNVGDPVYRVTQKNLTIEAENSYADDFARKIPVEMHFEAALGKLPILRMRECGMRSWHQIQGEQIAEPAVNRPLDEERVKKQLSKLGDTVFETSDISVQLDDNISLPISAINHMRREAASMLQAAKWETIREGRKALMSEELEEIRVTESLDGGQVCDSNAGKMINTLYHIYNDEVYELEKALKRAYFEAEQKNRNVRVCIPIETFMDDENRAVLEEKMPMVIPYILNVSKGKLDAYIEGNFHAICEKVRETGILIGNLGWIRQFQDAGIKVYGDYGLNVYNQQSLRTFEEMGVEILAWSHESEETSFENIPLMITEHPIPHDMITDRKGKTYDIVKCAFDDKSLIFRR